MVAASVWGVLAVVRSTNGGAGSVARVIIVGEVRMALQSCLALDIYWTLALADRSVFVTPGSLRFYMHL